jgi:DNA-binding XRE family transcriptional regulator
MDDSKFFGQAVVMEDIRNQTKLHIGKMIADALKARRITQAVAAKELGINQRSIAYWQQGQSLPGKDAQRTLENMLGWKEGAIGEAIVLGLSGSRLSEITPAWMAGRSGLPTLGEYADDDLGQELLGRLRNKDLEIRKLRAELELTRRQLAQPDYSLAAHAVEDSMSERFEREAQFRDGLESPDD